jgi:hypothetical protein
VVSVRRVTRELDPGESGDSWDLFLDSTNAPRTGCSRLVRSFGIVLCICIASLGTSLLFLVEMVVVGFDVILDSSIVVSRAYTCSRALDSSDSSRL